ncbi:uracil-DNA glycosylase family protein [Candidatus Riflebacteria bacterium]
MKRKFAELAIEIKNCKACKLYNSRMNAVPGYGDTKAKLLFIGEAPGFEEDKRGFPFIGKAGKLLDKILASVQITREEVFITNIIKCRPPGNRDPEQEEVRNCTPYLNRQISLIRPKIICTLGRHSMHFFLGPKSGGISSIMGKWFKIELSSGEEIDLMPLFHPAYLLRNPTKRKGGPKSLTWSAIREVKKRLDTI